MRCILPKLLTMMLISHPKMVYRGRGQKNSEVGIGKAENRRLQWDKGEQDITEDEVSIFSNNSVQICDNLW